MRRTLLRGACEQLTISSRPTEGEKKKEMSSGPHITVHEYDGTQNKRKKENKGRIVTREATVVDISLRGCNAYSNNNNSSTWLSANLSHQLFPVRTILNAKEGEDRNGRTGQLVFSIYSRCWRSDDCSMSAPPVRVWLMIRSHVEVISSSLVKKKREEVVELRGCERGTFLRNLWSLSLSLFSL